MAQPAHQQRAGRGQMPDLPRLDVPRTGPDSETLGFNVTQVQARRGRRAHPTECAIALCAYAAGLEAWINREVIYILRPATRALIAWNVKQGAANGSTWRTDGVRPGDPVLWRYILREDAQARVAELDGGGDFAAGWIAMRPPSPCHSLYRDKQGGRTTRAERADSHRDGKPPAFHRTTEHQRNIQVRASRPGNFDRYAITQRGD